MSSNLTPFAFGENLVRVRMDEDGDPWFVAKDVCAVLELDNSNISRQGYLDDDEKGLYTVQTPGGEQQMLTVSESGLYSLIFRSRKPEAKAFRKWVTSEVLPTLRKTGSYIIPGLKPGRRMTLPADLPPEALALRPTMRQRLWRDALDTARLDNAGLDVAMEWFGKLCCLMAASSPEPDSRSQKVRDFFAACCVATPGRSVKATLLYEAMRRWHRGKAGEMPSMRIFGEVMGYLAPRSHSNGSVYRDIDLRIF